MKNIIVGTAGHIDHGKTALVRALTGIDADRLKEEKERGITIDLGFAHMDFGEIRFGFIDVPGHERFVKNMLAGVGGIDLVLLVIAADESVMPQTREHFDICKLLKVQSGLVVITKKDLVEEDLLELVKAEVSELAANSFLEASEVVAVSSKTGEGIEDLKQALLRLALRIREKPSDDLFRLPIDRAFTIRGFGTVVTGTLISGHIAKDDEVEVLPTRLRNRVRGVQVYGQVADKAFAGQRTALNLHNIEVQQIERGMVLAHPYTLSPSSMLDVKLRLLASVHRPLRNLSKVRFHHGTSETIARVVLLGRQTLEPAAECYAQLRLDEPAVTVVGDAFIIRQFSPAVTSGGGVILDNHPPKHKQTDTNVENFLSRIESGTPLEKLSAFIKEANVGLPEKDLIARFGLTRAGLATQVNTLQAGGKIRIVTKDPFYLIDPQSYHALCSDLIKELQSFHRDNPLQKGISKEELKSRLFENAPVELFKYLIDDLVQAEKVSVVEDVVSIYGRQLSLSPHEQALRQDMENLFLGSGVQPPTLEETVAKFSLREKEDKIKKIFYLLIKERILIKIADDLTLHQKSLAELKARLLEKFPKGSKLSVGSFKDTFSISRKYAIPLLEYLDKERITRRLDGERIIL